LAIGAAATGIALFALGIKDATENGSNLLNMVLIPLGATLTGAAIGALIGSLGGPIGAAIGALIGLVIGLLVDLGILIHENWKAVEDPVLNAILNIEFFLATAFLALGALLALTGINLPLGIALIAIGAVKLAAAIAPHWDDISNEVKNVINVIEGVVSIALLTLGVIALFSGAGIPLGIGLLVAGAVGLATLAIPNWDAIVGKVKEILKEIGVSVGAQLLALGILLLVTGVGIPIGIALILLGAATLTAGVALNWDFFGEKIGLMLDGIKNVFIAFVNFGIGLIEGFLNSIIGLVNLAIRGLNLLGSVLGFEIDLIPEVHIPRLASGGYVAKGQLFIAREAGPELVGAIGGQTAVANNDQIVSAVASGVAQSNETQNELLREQNSILRALLEKDGATYLDGKKLSQALKKVGRESGVAIMQGSL
jgi:hypothetical protein